MKRFAWLDLVNDDRFLKLMAGLGGVAGVLGATAPEGSPLKLVGACATAFCAALGVFSSTGRERK